MSMFEISFSALGRVILVLYFAEDKYYFFIMMKVEK